jgi:hypothetical protein
MGAPGPPAQVNRHRHFTLSPPHFWRTLNLHPCDGGTLGCGPVMPVGWYCGVRRLHAVLVVGSDHEPCHCHRGMWLHCRRVFCIDAEPEFSQLIAADRVLAVRIRPPRRRGKNLIGADLPHAMPAYRPGGSRAVGDVCAQWLPTADRLGALGGGIWLPAARPEPGLRGASSSVGRPAGEEAHEEEAAGWRGGPGAFAGCIGCPTITAAHDGGGASGVADS